MPQVDTLSPGEMLSLPLQPFRLRVLKLSVLSTQEYSSTGFARPGHGHLSLGVGGQSGLNRHSKIVSVSA